jgi:hypothetical protein
MLRNVRTLYTVIDRKKLILYIILNENISSGTRNPLRSLTNGSDLKITETVKNPAKGIK